MIEQYYKKKYSSPFYFKKGTFESQKAGKLTYQNILEFQAFRHLEALQEVKTFQQYAVSYSYFNHKINSSDEDYVDFRIVLQDNTVKWIDLIPLALENDEETIYKTETIELIALDLGIKYQIWNEIDLFGKTKYYMESLIAFLITKNIQ